jgi:acetoacetyl-CoA synthetase
MNSATSVRRQESAEPLWTPSPDAVRRTQMFAFAQETGFVTSDGEVDYRALHAWSIGSPREFWSAAWDWLGVIGERGERIYEPADRFWKARFFPDARLNFAENLLRRSGSEPAVVFEGEDKVRERLSFDELRAKVSRLQRALRDAGIGAGDRVAAVLPNIPEALAIMLAASSIGAVWCSVSPDFGARGVVDRLAQIEPKILFVCDSYWYAGKQHATLPKLADILAGLPTLLATILVPYAGGAPELLASFPSVRRLDRFVGGHAEGPLTFERLPFDHPVSIMFSSGTTGVPKCIVHRAGGVLIQQMKEQKLHFDVQVGDRVFYFSTLSWTMWNWHTAALASGATLLMYDGSPFHPSSLALFEFAERERMTHFGTSAKFIETLRKSGVSPAVHFDLSSVRSVCSTGAPLSEEGYRYVYQHIGADVHLNVFSGGTDIAISFAVGNPTGPLYAGEMQGPALAMDVQVWDADGRRVVGEKGELVCCLPFPSMPLCFWNDTSDRRFESTYFTRFPGVWWHGDFAEETSHGGLIIHGRSDATLNPGGVRIGTAEIYAPLEPIDEIVESLAVGQQFDGDVRIVLFLRLRPGLRLDADLSDRVRRAIRSGATSRHVPARIVAVDDLPRTKNGKIAELAVRDVIHGRKLTNAEALANPECLDAFRDLPELRE